MPPAHASIAGQSRKSPAGSSLRIAGMRMNTAPRRSARPMGAASGSKAPKKTRASRGWMVDANSANSLGRLASTTSRPLASTVSVPTGPLLKSHTGRPARTER